jgi:thioesterase domain-containing protein
MQGYSARYRFAHDSVIPVRKIGDEHPLFLTYCDHEELRFISGVALHVKARVPIYGLSPLAAVTQYRLQTVPGIAAHMIEMMRAVQPFGAYRIAGSGFGGTLAYEIATQLIGDDQAVEFVGLFQSPCGAFAHSHGAGWRDFSLDIQREAREEKLWVRRLGTENGTVRLEADSCIPNLNVPLISSRKSRQPIELDAVKAFRRAQLWYRPQPIPLPISLFCNHPADPADFLRQWNIRVPKDQICVISLQPAFPSMSSIPVVKQLGEAVSRAMHGISHQKRPLPEKCFKPLVPLVVVPRAQSPLFCVPGAGASVISFVNLATIVNTASSVYGLELRGLDGVLVPYSTVSAAAQSYIRAINEVYPEGPVHLLGHSFGGWIVFEMAQLMEEAGRVVLSINILDSEAPDTPDTAAREYNPTETMLKLVDIYEQIVERSLDIAASDLELRGEESQLRLLHERLSRVRLVPERSQPDILRGPLRTFFTCINTRYVPKHRYFRPVHLLLPGGPKVDEPANRREREGRIAEWRRWAPNLVASMLPGNHMTVLKTPHVLGLAAILEVALRPGLTSSLLKVDVSLAGPAEKQ